MSQLNLIVSLPINLNCTKNKNFNNNCSKNEDKIRNKISNKKFKTAEKLLTHLNYTNNKSFNNENNDKIKDKWLIKSFEEKNITYQS